MSRLKELRKSKRLTQVQMQLLTGIDQSDYSKIENGRTNISVRRLHQLADYFYVFTADFLDPRRELPRYINEVDELTEKEHQYLNQYFAGILSSVQEVYRRGK